MPKASVVLESWKQYVAASLEGSDRYRLDGHIRSSNPISDNDPMSSGKWTVVNDGKKFRWHFAVPEDSPKTLAFDGKRWWLYGKTAASGRVQEATQNGKVLLNPQKVLAMDPRKPYLDGLVPIYPINLEHLLKNPTHSASQISIPEEYLARLSKVSISETTFEGQKAYRLSLKREKLAIKNAIPEVAYLGVVNSMFVPLGFEHITESGAVVKTSIRDYDSSGSITLPKTLTVQVQVDNGKGLATVAESKSTLDVTNIGVAGSDADFHIDFPNGTVVWEEEKKDAYLVGVGSLSKDPPSVTSGAVDKVAALGLTLLLISLILAGLRSRRKPLARWRRA